MGIFKIGSVVGLSVALAACGESDEVQANRLALQPLLQRHLLSTAAFMAETANADTTSETWADAFKRYEKYIGEKEQIQTDLRGVVSTPRFTCVSELLERSLQADLAMLRNQHNFFKQQLEYSTASDRAERYIAQIRGYSARTYSDLASESLEEANKALLQASRHRNDANAAARSARLFADSLAVAVRGDNLLPTVPSLPYFSVIDVGSHSLFQRDSTVPITVCGKPGAGIDIGESEETDSSSIAAQA